jgi:hypothetical protein
MNDFIDSEDHALLERHGLATYEALWALQLPAVDEPNRAPGGGWSSVYRLDLDGTRYYLKRQSNYLSRSLRRPLGEPTLAQEFRNIRHYRRLGIPAVRSAFFAERLINGEQRAILLTRALDGWQDLHSYLPRWTQLSAKQRLAIVSTCGALARRIHGRRQMHGCLYPKHIFLRQNAGRYETTLIDLEKTRPLIFFRRDRIKDLEPLLRRCHSWSHDDVVAFLSAYLGTEHRVDRWLRRLGRRLTNKQRRQ